MTGGASSGHAWSTFARCVPPIARFINARTVEVRKWFDMDGEVVVEEEEEEEEEEEAERGEDEEDEEAEEAVVAVSLLRLLRSEPPVLLLLNRITASMRASTCA